MANKGMFVIRLSYVIYIFALVACGVYSTTVADETTATTIPSTATSKTTTEKATTTTTTLPPSISTEINDKTPTKKPPTPKAPNTTAKPTIHKQPVNKTKEVCYEPVGCFDNIPPFDNAETLLPISPEEIGTQFSLFTRDGPFGNGTYDFIDYVNISSLAASNFSADKPTKFVVHGFSNSIKEEWIHNMKDELLKKVDCNVMMVSWGPGAAFPNYPQAVANTRVVARQLKIMLLNMIAIGSTYESIHMIGHSLGAHISGHVGQLLRKDNITFARITGLDPAEPDYKDHPTEVRLDKKDAVYVDVIHTNGAPFLSTGGAGLFEPCGDVDFYVNGGKEQPDCPSLLSWSHVSALFGGKVNDLATDAACSHSRAHSVFIESINSDMCRFTGYPCSDYKKFQDGECLTCGDMGCSEMGYDSINYYATGMLFLNTRMSPPFCAYHYGVSVMMSNKFRGTNGKVAIKLTGTWGVSEWLNVTRTDNDKLNQGAVINRVAVEEQVVGEITSMQVKYDKHTGGFMGFGNGRNTAHVDQIIIKSGQNDDVYTFCLNSTLTTGVEATLFPSETPCPV